MKFSEFTKERLRSAKIIRQLKRDGYEEVGEGGGKLWEIYRGHRLGHKILDAVISPNGMSIYVKIGAKPC